MSIKSCIFNSKRNRVLFKSLFVVSLIILMCNQAYARDLKGVLDQGWNVVKPLVNPVTKFIALGLLFLGGKEAYKSFEEGHFRMGRFIAWVVVCLFVGNLESIIRALMPNAGF